MTDRRSSAALIAALLIAAAAAAVRGADTEKDARTAWDRVVSDPRSDDRAVTTAANRLRDAESPKGVEALVEMIGRERRIASIVAVSLAGTRDAKSARSLAKALESSKEPRERRLLCEALAHVPGDEVTKAL